MTFGCLVVFVVVLSIRLGFWILTIHHRRGDKKTNIALYELNSADDKSTLLNAYSYVLARQYNVNLFIYTPSAYS